jgi:hypothetical protein
MGHILHIYASKQTLTQTQTCMQNSSKKLMKKHQLILKCRQKKSVVKTYRIPPRTTPNGFSSAAKPMVAS